MPPRGRPHPATTAAAFLVANHVSGCEGLHHHLPGVRPREVLEPTAGWSPSSTIGTSTSMVPHRCGFCDWPSTIRTPGNTRVWRKVCIALLRSSLLAQRQPTGAGPQLPLTSPYRGCGSCPRLSTRGGVKLAPRFIGPFEVDRMINAVAFRLRLPASLKVRPTFHVCWVKPVRKSALSQAAEKPPQSESSMAHRLTRFNRSLMFAVEVGAGNTW